MIMWQSWRERAACAGRNPNLWFPEGGTPGPATREALATCTACPVITDCLAHALEQPENHGIWGGTTETERAAMNGRIRCGTTAGYRRHQRNGSSPCRSCQQAHDRRPATA